MNLPNHITLVDENEQNQNIQLAKAVFNVKPKVFKYKNEGTQEGFRHDMKKTVPKKQ